MIEQCVVVSACLLGENCKYNGKNNLNDKVMLFLLDKKVLPICPEQLAGLPTPRPSAEMVNARVTEQSGKDVHDVYQAGVDKAMAILAQEQVEAVVLQSRSPTCGANQIYDGTFTGKLISGSGLFAQELKKQNYSVIDVADL
ncbi:DUF523 domain-containing protein [Neisseria sp. S1]|uniref:DUF523 domain-containing protein n=1 Tax=Neisseria sp. S1 TaxID=3318354 RepID=UPI003A894CB4